MFDHLFPLLGSSGIALPLLSALGVVATIVLSEVLGTALRARHGRGRTQPRAPRSLPSPSPSKAAARALPFGHLSA